MDPIISKLNQIATTKVGATPGEKVGPPTEKTPAVSFDQTLSEKMIESISKSLDSGPTMTVAPADSIHVKDMNAEVASSRFEPQDKIYDLFKDVSKSLNSLDANLEIASTPGVELSRGQLLCIQASIAQTSLLAESFSKFVDGITKGIQTVVQSQV